MKKLGIVGHGFVGSAINQGFTKNIQKYIVDPNKFSGNTITTDQIQTQRSVYCSANSTTGNR